MSSTVILIVYGIVPGVHFSHPCYYSKVHAVTQPLSTSVLESIYLVEWAIALHGMYESALFFCFNFKTEEHVNVTSGT
jgi:hypothetical protein